VRVQFRRTHPSREVRNSWFLFDFVLHLCVYVIISMEKVSDNDIAKLNGAVFIASQCSGSDAKMP